ncbi:aminoglycoside phosphotransferase [Sandaracinobacter neustonicus]|uniref:Aminoglycoside phosphotransferase n=1 Tax=Sandaracinobacter neustonicus TaxID=1715348 RepID=A0A501XNP7_9SPHN|nr:phosphotransferase [Sandaracinobacter neustonicus]TPE62291.1 aminoglycoside phosphotransferase [Sandaracinobacter neustonicus]
MIARDGAAQFLKSAGWGDAEILPLAGDASFRRYFRVVEPARRAVLMDAPPEHEDVKPFLAVADLLLEAGFSAPAILARDLERGFLLIEDFGDRLLGPVLKAEPALEAHVYAQAVDLLTELHRATKADGLPPYDRAVLAREVMLFPDWYANAAGIEVDTDAYLAAWDAVWADVLAETAQHPIVTLRDYHADNLMLLERPGVKGLGLLDFQDALAGHPAYDLVSLLQDARRDVSPELEAAMLARFDGSEAFRAAYEVLGAQRNVKILGIFVRLRDRDGRQGYVERLPRVWGYLDRNFAHPALAPVKQWFDAHVPAALRAEWCR